MTKGVMSGTTTASMLATAVKSRSAAEGSGAASARNVGKGKNFESYLEKDRPPQEPVKKADSDVKADGKPEDVKKPETVKTDNTVQKPKDAVKPEEAVQAEDAAEEMPEESMELLASAIIKFLNTAATDILSVNPEDIKAWMADNGMSLADMLDPNNLRQMVLDLNGLTDVAGFLTDETALGEWTQVQDLFRNFLAENAPLIEEWHAAVQGAEAAGQDVVSELLQTPVGQEAEPETVQPEQADAEMQQAEQSAAARTEEAPKQQTGQENGQEDDPRSETALKNTEHQEQRMDTGTENPAGTFLGHLNEAVVHAAGSLEGTSDVRQTASTILNQVVNEIRVNMSQEVTSMDFMLNPESLGRVHVAVSAKNGIMTAQLTVQNQEAKEALEGQLITLKQTFEEQGLKVESVEVNVSEFAFGEESMPDDGSESGQRRQDRRNRRTVQFDESLGQDGLPETEQEERAAGLTMTGGQVDFSA